MYSFENVFQNDSNPVQQDVSAEPQTENPEQPKNKKRLDLKRVVDNFMTALPPVITTPGNKIMHTCSMVSLFALAFVYIVCFFVFMADIAFVVGCRALPDSTFITFSTSGSRIGVNGIWMIAYFIINLFPAGLAIFNFLKPQNKYMVVIASCICLIITVFSLIAWGSCNANDFIGAVSIYPIMDKWTTFAWYCLVDCLSEAWYLKIPIALIACFSYGIDYIVNNKK